MCLLQARALTAQTAETDAIRFLVGTQSLKFDNQVSKTTVHKTNPTRNKAIFSVRGGGYPHSHSCIFCSKLALRFVLSKYGIISSGMISIDRIRGAKCMSNILEQFILTV